MNWGKRIKITEIFVLFGYRYAVYYYQSIFSHSFRSYEPTRITQRHDEFYGFYSDNIRTYLFGKTFQFAADPRRFITIVMCVCVCTEASNVRYTVNSQVNSRFKIENRSFREICSVF